MAAPNSIRVLCAAPESGMVIDVAYVPLDAVMPCLSQPPPGTVMVRLAPPEGVKSHVPAIDVVVGSAAVEAAQFAPPAPELPPVP